LFDLSLKTHPAGQRGSSWSWAARSWAEGAGVGAGSQEEAHSVACSRSSRSPQARLPQPRQYPPWARSPLKRPPPAHLRSSTTQNTYHRPHVIAHLTFLTTLLYYYCFSLIHYKYKISASSALFKNASSPTQIFMLGSLNE